MFYKLIISAYLTVKYFLMRWSSNLSDRVYQRTHSPQIYFSYVTVDIFCFIMVPIRVLVTKFAFVSVF